MKTYKRRNSKFRNLPVRVQDELIERILTGERYSSIIRWLGEVNGVPLSKTHASHYGKFITDKFKPLMDLGMPIETIVQNRARIEATGIEQVRLDLIAELTKRQGPLFAYLDEAEDGQ
jgi:hypothetical protein